MSEFIKFLSRLIDRLNLDISISDVQKKVKDEYELAANILGEINKFLYQKNAKLEDEYISEFHKYWKANHEKVLYPTI